jgi:F-type H+-transporting ATPase subunit delta
MAELATLARPYAEALFEVASGGDLQQATRELDALAAVAGNAQLRQFADAPKADPAQVFDLVTSVAGVALSEASKNLLRTVIDNGRLAAMPGIASQFRALAGSRSGIFEAIVESAFPIDASALAELTGALERRFARRLSTSVRIVPALIGGVRVVVGDEVLDTSVKARLEQMRAVLTA